MVAQINKHYLGYGVGRVVRRIASYTLFEGRPHTTRGQWFNPVVFALLRMLAEFPGRPTLQRPIFITGMGRSGTTLLGTILSLHRDVGFLNEPKALWTTVNPCTDINGDYRSAGGLFRMDGTHATRDQQLCVQRLYSRYLMMTRTLRVVDKYPEMIFRVEYLLTMFPDAQIIFITRNGSDACGSVAEWSARHNRRVGNRVDDWWGRNAIKWRYLCDEIVKREARYTSLSNLDLSTLDQVNRAAVEWVVTMQSGMEAQRKYPQRVIRINYEALVANPRYELEQLLNGCQLKHDPAVFSYAERHVSYTPPRSAPRLLAVVHKLFTETADELGYLFRT